MPYSGVADKDVPRLDKCVQEVMKQGHGKSSAIAICRSSMKLASADEPAPPDIPLAAKLALALQVMAISDRVLGAVADAPADMDMDAFADSLTDEGSADIAGSMANMFEGTHATNIASEATGRLRDRLADPNFRKAHPYVMLVSTDPDARLSHKLLDGYIMSSEDAQYSPYLPPFDFGCDCQVIPITAEQAQEAGLTGNAPMGSVTSHLKSQGYTTNYAGEVTGPRGERMNIGRDPGFSPAYSGTDNYVQLQAIRQKAEDIRADDPEGWSALAVWLAWLFGEDVLRRDPEELRKRSTPGVE